MKWLRKKIVRRKIARSGYFDRQFYLTFYPDVAASKWDALEHFARFGTRDARSPSAAFDTAAYLRDNPDARKSVNPVIDWLEHRTSGRRYPPRPIPVAGQVPHAVAAGTPATAAAHVPPAPAPEVRIPDDLRAKIEASGLFDAAYYAARNPDLDGAVPDLLSHYLTDGWREMRNPSAGFDTHYMLNCGIGQGPASGLGPLAREVQAPHGGPCLPADAVRFAGDGSTRSPDIGNARVAIQIHMFYADMVELFWAYLGRLDFAFDLLISTTTAADKRFIENYFRAYAPASQAVTVRLVPNHGRDIAPMLVGFQDRLGDYDAICHLHSKRSLHTHFGENWLIWIMDHMFGSSGLARQAIAQFQAHDDCAIVMPENYPAIVPAIHWGGNEPRIIAVLERLGLKAPVLPPYANFAAGSMCWYRGDLLARLAAHFTLDQFEEEDGQLEGTLAHVLERALAAYALVSGQRVVRYYLDQRPQSLPIRRRYGPVGAHDAVGSRWSRDTPEIGRNRPRPLAPISPVFNPDALHIHWIIPDFTVGAGGHMTIFRMVEFLDQFGHHQTIWIQNPWMNPTPVEARRRIIHHYRPFGDRVHVRFLPDDVRQLSGDVIIATDCWTAFPVSVATNFKERFYFIQDYEPMFHPMGENYLIAEWTYGLGFAALCAGDWLADKAAYHGMWARTWTLAADRDHYYPPVVPRDRADKQGRPARRRIAFYYRPDTPRRAVKLGVAGLRELARRRDDFEVWMFGDRDGLAEPGFPARNCGIATPAELGEIYRGADIGLSFSTTNYSLVPLEMMACDLPVVEIASESAKRAFPVGSVVLADPTPISVADALDRLLDNAELRAETTRVARDFINGLSWQDSARTIERALLARLDEKGFQRYSPPAPAIVKTRKASVVIPSWNAGPAFAQVLERLQHQICDFDYDVLVVDSSSTDGTADMVRAAGHRIRCETIPQSAFQHGRTRNLAIAHTDGEVVAVLTQDALPADAHWLANLVAPFADAQVGGAIGRHRAYPEHNPLVARDIDTLFDRLRDFGPHFSMAQGLPGFMRAGSPDWKMLMHFYSDNNSAMRRSVWQVQPYPEVDWGEDQIWGWEILRLGLTKAYADDSVVFHSHDLPRTAQIKSSIAEGDMMATYFGYRLAEAPMSDADRTAMTHAALQYATAHGLPIKAVKGYVEMCEWSTQGRAIGLAAADERILASET